MATTTTNARRLDENATVRIPRRGSPTVVRVEQGTVLLTQEGDLDDHVLEAGDEAVFRGDGLVVAWAFREAVISVHDAAPRGATAPRSSANDELTPRAA